MGTRQISFTKAVNEALNVAMELDPGVLCFGLGVDDPRGVFGTTLGLKARFGAERVFDMPTSENAMTGVAIGASLGGQRPVMVHQRLDFFLLALDQLVNNAAKWRYMFGGRGGSVPITIRLIVGRGWGQGPTHSQSLHSLFAQIPGLKVVLPSTAAEAKGLLLSSIFDDDPVVFIEHRWLHGMQGEVPEGDFRLPLGKASVPRRGDDVTVAAFSYMTIEALRAADCLKAAGVGCEVIDLRSVKPVDWETVLASVRRTGRLLALDTGPASGSVASEIVARASLECFADLRCAPRRLALPDFPVPTSFSLTKGFYANAGDIVRAVCGMLGKAVPEASLPVPKDIPHDVPGDWFKGPF